MKISQFPLGGLVLAYAIAAPAAWRAHTEQLPWVNCLLVLGAGGSLFLQSLWVLAPRVQLGTPGALPRPLITWCVALSLALVPSLALAALLAAFTHHRPLAGVTYAVLVGALLAASVALVRALDHLTWFNKIAILVLKGAGGLALFLALLVVSTPQAAFPGQVSDAALLVLAALLILVFRERLFQGRFSPLSVAIWLAFVGVGFSLTKWGTVLKPLGAISPLLTSPFAWLGD